MPKFLYILFTVCVVVLLGNTCTTSQKATATGEISKTSLNGIVFEPINYFPDSLSEITINLVGDLMCHKPQTTNAEVKPGVYDFKP